MIGYGPFPGRMAAWPGRAPLQGLKIAVTLSVGGASAHPEKGVVMRRTIGRRCRYWAIGASAAVVGLAVLAGPAGAARADPRMDLKNFQHVFVLIMGNTGSTTCVRNPHNPWINRRGPQNSSD